MSRAAELEQAQGDDVARCERDELAHALDRIRALSTLYSVERVNPQQGREQMKYINQIASRSLASVKGSK